MEQLNTALNRYYDSKIKIRSTDRASALEAWQKDVKAILAEVKANDPRFEVQMHYTGSFYERAKTEQPDEFDLMFELTKINAETSKKAVVSGFTYVTITDPTSKHEWSRDGIVDGQGRLDAVKMKSVFARLVSDAIRKVSTSNIKQRTHGPAVTLYINTGSGQVDVDLTLAIKLRSWPAVTTSWKSRPRKGWPSSELLSAVESAGCFVVAKQPASYTGGDKPLMWRFSFSLAEKTIMTMMDGGIPNSCRRKVLQILKSIISNDPQLRSVPLSSYYMKSLIFWECEKFPSGSDWDSSKIGERFLSAIQRLLTFVKKKSFPHYFLNNFNLLAYFKPPHYPVIIDKFEKIKGDPVPYISRL